MPTTLDIPAPERARATEACRACLAGRLGIIETVHALADLAHVRAAARDDAELAVLDALATESAHLVTGDARAELDGATRAEQDAERARLEMLVRDDALAACRVLLDRLGG